MANLFTIPAELKQATGLSEAQLTQILSGGSKSSTAAAPSSTCAEDNTTVVFPNPTLPSKFDLVKRNAFVKRFPHLFFLILKSKKSIKGRNTFNARR